MPDEVTDEPTGAETSEGVFASFGIGSAVLGVIAIAAIALATLIWAQHRSDADELRYQYPRHTGRRRLDRRADQHE